EIEVGGDLFRGRAGRQLPEDLDLAFRELLERESALRQALQRESLRDVVAHGPFAPGDGTDCLDEHRRLAALGDIAARTGVEGGLHQRRLAVHAEDENARAAAAQADVPDRLETA